MTHIEYVNMSVRTIGMPKFDLSCNYLDNTTGQLTITTFWLGYINDDVLILDRSWVYNAVKGNTREKKFKQTFCKYCKDHPNKKFAVGSEVRDAISETAKYYNYRENDVVTHVRYNDLTTLNKPLKKRKLEKCPWQGKTRSGDIVLLTSEWFLINIEFGKRTWYTTSVDKDIKKNQIRLVLGMKFLLKTVLQ